MDLKLNIIKLKNGKYGLSNNEYLYFDGDFEATAEPSKDNECLITINKKSALEVAHTLIDSLGLLDQDAENLLYKIEDEIEKEEH